MKFAVPIMMAASLCAAGAAEAATTPFTFGYKVVSAFEGATPNTTFDGLGATGNITVVVEYADGTDIMTGGPRTFGPSSGLKSVSFTLFGQTFKASDDEFFKDPFFSSPSVEISGGKPTYFAMSVNELGADASLDGVSTAIDKPNVISFVMEGVASAGAPFAVDVKLGLGSGCCTAVKPVPLPASAALLLGAMGLVGATRLTRKSA